MLQKKARLNYGIALRCVASQCIAYPPFPPEKLMAPYMAIEQEYDKGFYTDERCIACETCAKVCPTKNITMQNHIPFWNHRCHGCNACVAYCPTKAIQFTKPEAYRQLNGIVPKLLRLPEKRKRYHNPFIKAADLSADKQNIGPKPY